MKISDLSIKRPIYVIVMFLVIGILGLLGFSSMKSELMPKFSPPSINVQVVYPGASPSEVESSLTVKLEDALSSMAGVESMRSYSLEGMSMVFVSFTYGTDIDKAVTDAQNKINSKKAELPSGILAPMVNEIGVDAKSVITLALSSDLDPMEFSDLISQDIVPEFQRIPGMAKVETVGEHPREIQVNMDMAVMRELGLTPIQVLGVLKAGNLDFPTGSLQDGRTHTAIRLSGKLKDLDEIRSLVLMTLPNGTQIRLSDIADVVETSADVNTLAKVNGEQAVLLNIFKQENANAIDLSDDVRETVTSLEERYADSGLSINTVSDTSDFTRESIKSVLEDLILAILLVTLVILIFLHNWRNALIVMLVVPLSLIGTFIGMKLFNFTLNIMSLLGLSVVIGVLVDDAIVVIENVCRHMEMGKSPIQATRDAMSEIGFTVISVTVVLVIVFLPIALTNSLVSDILRQFCGVIIFSILFSLLSALTLVPLLTSRFGKMDVLDTNTAWGRIMSKFEKGVRNFSDGVAGLLKKALGHKKIVGLAVLAVTVLVCSLFPMGFVGFEFMPKVDQSEFTVMLEMPKDISIEESAIQVSRAEAWLLDRDEITEVVSMIGLTSSNSESNQGTPYLAELKCKMVPPSERDKSVHYYISVLRKQLTDYLVDAKVQVHAASLHGSGNGGDIEYVLSGSKADSVALFGEYALEQLRGVPGTLQQQLSTGSGRPEVDIVVDRDKMSALGLSLDNVGLTLQMAFQGNTTMKFVRDDREYNINLRADNFYRTSIDDVAGMTFVNQQGSRITLDQFAQVRIGTGPNRLERYNRNPSVTISANVVGTSAGQASSEFLDRISDKAGRMGVSIETVGDMKSMMDSMSVFAIAILLSIALMYLALVLLYNNWTDPLVVMFSIPFSILGAILALALSATSLNIYAMLGLVMLIGLVAKNAILLVDFAGERLREGMDMDDALIEAVKLRTRPILMTAISTIIGMVPVALASGSSAELRNGIGWVIIGGMALSTLLTLIVVPVVYKVFHRKKAK
ncbi:MAG: efflux RND transporter permease subunit [Bacteroidales bacterium]|nr:efflux RND transporter permease subunit [Bacteroidales bacterium]